MTNFYHVIKISIVAILLLALTACKSADSADAEIGSTDMNTVVLLGFDGCPLTPLMKTRVEDAIEGLSPDVRLVVIDQNELDSEDLRRGYPAPTLLVRGRDLFGMQAPTSPAMSCRVYPGPNGVPSVSELTERLQDALGDHGNTEGDER